MPPPLGPPSICSRARGSPLGALAGQTGPEVESLRMFDQVRGYAPTRRRRTTTEKSHRPELVPPNGVPGRSGIGRGVPEWWSSRHSPGRHSRRSLSTPKLARAFGRWVTGRDLPRATHPSEGSVRRYRPRPTLTTRQQTPHLGVSGVAQDLPTARPNTPCAPASRRGSRRAGDVQRACFTWSHRRARVVAGE
jgi:hypothetical protein